MHKFIIYGSIIFLLLAAFQVQNNRPVFNPKSMLVNQSQNVTDTIPKQSEEVIKKRDILNKEGKFSFSVYDYDIHYSDSLKTSIPTWSIKWDVQTIKNSDSIQAFIVNPNTHQIARMIKNGNELSLLIDINELPCSKGVNRLSDFVGNFLVLDKSVPDNYGGIITKFTYELNGNNLMLQDSIVKGFGEGYGFERIMLEDGQPLTDIIDFDVEFTHYWDYKNLIVNVRKFELKKSQYLLINAISKDTTANFLTDLRDIRKVRYSKNSLLFYYCIKSRLNRIAAYDHTGNIVWDKPVNTISKILANEESDLMILSGYYFTGIPDMNSVEYFTAGYNLENGNKLWDFPTGLAYDSTYCCNNRIETPNLFEINNNLFGLIVGKWADYGPDYKAVYKETKLILFDRLGQVNAIINLSKGKDRYVFDKIDDNRFNIVGYRENWIFTISNK
ncbi:MAG: hypothetical protein KDC79_04955 [Cyclobacteriaceae bacterium]|nr:hypothetical protein [Cyclobacteriaceae bacterium]